VKTSSAKAKGRRLQQYVRDSLRAIGLKYGLIDGDCESRGMGQNGVDIILSPAAIKVFPFAVECKNVETLNVTSTFLEHFDKYKDESSLKLLIHSRNKMKEPLVTMRWSDFLAVYNGFLGSTKL
jgi:hypothetical protein